jgi:hypothetical protein
MPFVVDADVPTLGVTFTVPQLCALMAQTHHPQQIGFPGLGGRLVELLTREESVGPRGDEGVRSIGLSTCASVIYSNATGTAFYVVHANAGDVTAAAHLRAVDALGGDARALYVAFTHQNDDADYAESLDELITGRFRDGDLSDNARIPDAQAVRIKNLRLGSFGVNSYGWLGY